MDEILKLFKKAADQTVEFVNNIKDEDWSRQSVDSEWDVKQLVRHIVYESLWVPDLLEGKTLQEVGDKYEGDILGDDPKKATKEALDKATQVVMSLKDLDFKVSTSMGNIPAIDYLNQMLFDLTIHGWDVAASTNQSDILDIELVNATYQLAQKYTTEFADYNVFGPKVDVSEDVDKQTKLLALTGRKAN